LAIDNVSAFDRDDFIFANMGGGKQSAPVDFALAHFRFRRTIGERYHNLATLIAFVWFGVDTTAPTTLSGSFTLHQHEITPSRHHVYLYHGHA
jgi:hypothetical protein